MGMTKRFWMLLACLLLVCTVALAECAVCSGDGVCDTCNGLGYVTMQLYGSDEQIKVVCNAGCDNGICTACTPFPAAVSDDETHAFADAMVEGAVRAALEKPSGKITYGDLQSLAELDLYELPLRSLEDLRYMPNLVHLRLVRNGLTDELLAPLSSLTKMESLYLTSNNVSDLTVLAPLVHMDTLSLSGNQIRDLTPLSSMKKLTCLWISENQVEDLSPLKTLTDLTDLWASSNRITDLSPLTSLVNLSALGISNNRIDDLSPLANLVLMERLYLDNNRVSDLTPLRNMAELHTLSAEGNPIADASVLDGLSKLKSPKLDPIKAVSAADPTPTPQKAAGGMFLTRPSDKTDAAPKATPKPTATPAPTIAGKVLTLVVLLPDETLTYEVITDETYLLDALLKCGFIDGEEVSWGFNVTTVDGYKADYERRGEYWEIFEYEDAAGQFYSLSESIATKKIDDIDGYAFRLAR